MQAPRRLVRSGLVALLLAAAAAAQDASSENDLLRARVEQIHANRDVQVRGVTIASRRTLPALYERRDFSLVWTGKQASDDLLRAIQASKDDGLDPEDYLLAPLLEARAATLVEGAPLDARIDYDLLQTDALGRLLYHLIFGKVDPHELDANWNFTRSVHQQDPPGFLLELIDSGELFERIEAEKPAHRMYGALRVELGRLRELEARGGYPLVDPGPTLAPGAQGARVAAVRSRLEASRDLRAPAEGAPDAFDSTLEQAVAAFQTRRGLDADGRVGPGTLRALNTPIAAEILQVRVNLERGRWLLHEMPPTFVVVNVAGFEVYYLRDHETVWSARAMVGKPYRKTPIFRSEITYLVLNPTWTVPPTIFANDILPAQRRNPSYLANRGLQVIDSNGRAVATSSIDWQNVDPKRFPYMIRQDPGPNNALGRVKFMFPNSYAVYLHDTPSQSLFEKSERAASSGCIRVERPLELAALLLEHAPGWDRAAIDRVIEGGKLQNINLPEPVPVLLAYWTAWVDRAGVLQLRSDVYGLDPQVAKALAAPFHVRRPAS